MKKKIVIMMAVMAGVLTMTACEQKAVEIKSETAQQKDLNTNSNKDESNSKNTSAKKELSEDIYTFQLSVNGKVMQFPMTYAKFTKYGWDYKGNEEGSISEEDEMLSDWFVKSGDQVLTYLSNFDTKSVMISESYVTGIIADQNLIKNEKTEILLPGNIQLGISTQEDVQDVYGNPMSKDERDSFPTMTYELDNNQYVSLVFDSKNEHILTEITIKNDVLPDNFETSENDDQIPQVISDYQTPETLSQDLFDYTVSFDGAFYQIAAPVSEFLANDWTLVESESDMLVESKKTGKVMLAKDGQTFWTEVTNLGDDTDEIINCFVTNLSANVKDCNVDMEIANGIKMGMSQEDLETAMEAYKYKKQTSSYTYYVLDDPEQEGCGYEIIVKNGIVTGIEMLRKSDL